jgi:putative aldouronate transport system substrate-binding protein
MKTVLKRLCALTMAAALLGSSLAGCGSKTTGDGGTKSASSGEVSASEENTGWDGTMPITEEPISITIAAKQASYVSDWNGLPVLAKLEERTNVHVDYQMVPEQGSTEKFNVMLAGNELPDAFLSSDFTPAQLVSNGKNGIFLNIKDLLAENTPNFNKVLEENPEVKADITAPDGNIYAMPQLYMDFPSLGVNKLWFNDNWLEALDAELPTTMDELYDLMVRMHTEDPNGNGEQDELPLSNAQNNVDNLVTFFGGAYGVCNRGDKNKNIDFDEESQKVRYYPTTDGYKEMMKFFVKCYQEGLIDPELFTMDKTKLLAKGAEGKVGMFIQPNTFYETADMTLTPLGEPLIGPEGDQLLSAISPMVCNVNGLIITATNPYPEETLRWVDYFYGDEGAELIWMGIKDDTYYEDENGDFKYKDEYLDPFPQSLGETTCWMAIAWPGIKSEKFGGGVNHYGPKTMAANETLQNFQPEEIWPQFMFEPEESDKVVQYESDLNSYIKDMQAQWITGRTDVDGSWDEFLSTLKTMGSEELTALYQAAYDRRLSNENE